MLRKDFEVIVLVNGNQVKEYEHQGSIFIEGKQSTEFSVRVKNNTHKRTLAVLTIDGKSVIDGSTGSIDNSGGYIVAPYSSVTIPGWRINDNEVAKFIFADKEQSYSAQIGEGSDNVGVIGCAIFHEIEFARNLLWINTSAQPINPVYYPVWDSSKNTIPCGGINDVYHSSASDGIKSTNTSSVSDINTTSINTTSCSAVLDSNVVTDNCASVNNLGTGFGQQANHSITTSSFNRYPEPEVVFTTYYDTREGLINRGVNLQPKVQVCPSPFPASKGRGCPIPQGWGNKTNNNKVTQIDVEKRKKLEKEIEQEFGAEALTKLKKPENKN